MRDNTEEDMVNQEDTGTRKDDYYEYKRRENYHNI